MSRFSPGSIQLVFDPQEEFAIKQECKSEVNYEFPSTYFGEEK